MAYVYVDKLKYKKRLIEQQLDRYLGVYGAVCIEGPKYCGKTLTALHYSKSGFDVGSPTNGHNNRALTNLSPFKVLEGHTPRLLVEWEEAPVLWETIKEEVGRRFLKGQFIMTNSFRPKLENSDGAGKICSIKMRTMTLYETGDSTGDISLNDICNNNIEQSLTGDVDLVKLANLIVRGGWPENIEAPIEKINSIMNSYIKEVIKQDLIKFDNKEYQVDKLMLLLNALAKNEGTTAPNTKLLKDIKAINKSIDINTITTYVDIFERTFISDNQEAFTQDVNAPVRIKQAAKRHLADTSLVCALQGLNSQKLLSNIRLFSKLFKSLCVHDLMVYAEANGDRVSYYDDYSCREIDAVIENTTGKWSALDIRLGTNEIDAAAKELLEIKQDIKENGGNPPSALCVICGMSNMAYRRADGVMVVPFTALKN